MAKKKISSERTLENIRDIYICKTIKKVNGKLQKCDKVGAYIQENGAFYKKINEDSTIDNKGIPSHNTQAPESVTKAWPIEDLMTYQEKEKFIDNSRKKGKALKRISRGSVLIITKKINSGNRTK